MPRFVRHTWSQLQTMSYEDLSQILAEINSDAWQRFPTLVEGEDSDEHGVVTYTDEERATYLADLIETVYIEEQNQALFDSDTQLEIDNAMKDLRGT